MSKLKNLIKQAEEKKANSALAYKYGLGVQGLTLEKMAARLEMHLAALRTGELTLAEHKDMVLDFFGYAFSQRARKEGCFHPSEIANDRPFCKRKMYFQWSKHPQDSNFLSAGEEDNRLMRMFDLGSMLHLYIQFNLVRAGILDDYEVEVDWPEYGIYGFADGTFPVGYLNLPERSVCEIKSINTIQFDKLKEPLPNHIDQDSFYTAGLGLKYIVYIYYNKNNSDQKQFVATRNDVFLEEFKLVAGEVMRKHQTNSVRTRSTDISKHELFPRTVCSTRVCNRAQSCAYAGSCFSMK